MRIGDREIGVNHPPYIIAEIGVNHDGEVARALELTDAAADAGADAVKLQYFQTNTLLSKAAILAGYQRKAGEMDPVAMLRRLEFTPDDLFDVYKHAHLRGIDAIVTVFSSDLIELARQIPWDAYKTASPDITNIILLCGLSQYDFPIIVSTGASTLDEVTRAYEWLEPTRQRLAFLQCVSSYPAPDPAFGGIAAIHNATGVPTGYSDHTIEMDTGKRAVEHGACILERHITYDKRAAGPDHQASLDPDEFAEYSRLAKSAVQNSMTSPPVKAVQECEMDVRLVSRQSIVTSSFLPRGTTIVPEYLTIKRPGTGIEPFHWDRVVGKTTIRDVERDMPLMKEDLC